MAVNFLPQAQLRYPESADVSQGISGLGNALAQSFKETRDRNALIKVSNALQGGDTSGARAAAFESGNPQLALSVNNLLTSQEQRKEDVDFRNNYYKLRERTTDAIIEKSGIPAGFKRDSSGSLTYIPGGPADPSYKRQVTDRQNAPAGYKWVDPNNPDAGLKPIPGGPGEKVDAEVAARIGLGRSFLGQLEDYKDPITGEGKPGIMPSVKAGEATGPIDFVQGRVLGWGRAGEVHRQIASGAEALLRNLTGAGMNKDEAAEYVNRYRPSIKDDADSLSSKLVQLQRELNSVMETVGRGRGGMQPAIAGSSAAPTPGTQPAPAPAVPNAAAQSGAGNDVLAQARDALAKGASREAVLKRLRERNIDPAGL